MYALIGFYFSWSVRFIYNYYILDLLYDVVFIINDEYESRLH